MITSGQTGVASDFITKAEQNATRSNDSGKVPQLETDGFLDTSFTKESFLAPIFEPLNGATTPVPVIMGPNGDVVTSDADGLFGITDFIGFVKKDNSAFQTAAYLGVTDGGNPNTTFSHTLQAGTKRVILVFVMRAVVGTPTVSTGVTFNGQAMTLVLSSQNSNSGIDVWRLVMGTSASPTTANIIVTGGSGFDRAVAVNYEYVDQTTPISASVAAVATTSGNFGNGMNVTQAYSLVVMAMVSRTGNSGALQPPNNRQTAVSASRLVSDGFYRTIVSGFALNATAPSGTSGTDRCTSVQLSLNNSETTTAEVFTGGIIDGFTGLTKGSRYYLSDTIGTIATTPGSTSRLVGKAISATQLKIIQPV